MCDEIRFTEPRKLIFFGGSEILKGLESAARMGFENIQNAGEIIKPEHMIEKTKKIRATLTEHYIGTVRKYHEVITTGIFPLVINNIQQIKARLLELVQSKYRPALETIMSHEIEGEYSSRTKGIEDRSRRFRDTIEQVEQLGNEMASVFAEAPT